MGPLHKASDVDAPPSPLWTPCWHVGPCHVAVHVNMGPPLTLLFSFPTNKIFILENFLPTRISRKYGISYRFEALIQLILR